MEKVRGGRVRFEEERVVMSGGVIGVNEMFMFCLVDCGDVFFVFIFYYVVYVIYVFF